MRRCKIGELAWTKGASFFDADTKYGDFAKVRLSVWQRNSSWLFEKFNAQNLTTPAANIATV